MRHPGRLVSLVACIACLTTLSAGSFRPQARAHSKLARVVGGFTAADVYPAFRLGTAAQPLGWSTAVGDFNTDGKPDVVVADHASAQSGAYAYRIQFAVSGLGDRNFAFESSQSAVTVRISDVDHDNDLDVVVHAAASREVVGIWLNDGHGRFKAADIRRFASEIEPRGLLAAGAPTLFPGQCDLPPRRTVDPLAVRSDRAPAVSVRFWTAGRPLFSSAFHVSTTALRGPPPALA